MLNAAVFIPVCVCWVLIHSCASNVGGVELLSQSCDQPSCYKKKGGFVQFTTTTKCRFVRCFQHSDRASFFHNHRKIVYIFQNERVWKLVLFVKMACYNNDKRVTSGIVYKASSLRNCEINNNKPIKTNKSVSYCIYYTTLSYLNELGKLLRRFKTLLCRVSK